MTTREKEMLVTLMAKAVETGLWDNASCGEVWQWLHDKNATAPQYADALIGWVIPDIGLWRYDELMGKAS